MSAADDPKPAATAARRPGAGGAPDKRMMIAAALVLFGAIVIGIVAVSASVDTGPRKDTQGQQPETAGQPHIIPRPNEGVAPKDGGDRGGWEQITLMAVVVASVLLIGVLALRGGKRAKAGREAWMARAAEPDRPAWGPDTMPATTSAEAGPGGDASHPSPSASA